jgi:hypothetical protein
VKPKSNYRHLQVARGPTKYCGRMTDDSDVTRLGKGCRQYCLNVPASACIEVFVPLSLPKHKVSLYKG